MPPSNAPTPIAESDLAPGRECGACRACCQVFPINDPGLQKAAGVMCAHAVAEGCGIYETRPGACRRFHCLWRQTSALPDDARPDRLGAIFWVAGRSDPATVFETVYVAGAAVDDPRALDQDQVRDIVETLSREGALPVFLHWGGQEYLVHPPSEMVDAIVNPATTPHQAWIAPARAWLNRYLPVAEQYAARRRPPSETGS